ncbi:MAG TPA: type II toxin-antitoxin system CcdA family antitoxin [Treponemataceae bacterium]|nr:type II toxin-antitoxin system CcdA family antitoxin [Treponemataceae bacterium]
MSTLYNVNAPKRPTNLTVNSDLLTQAKDYKINVSATLETALAEALKSKKVDLWKEENREAIQSYNIILEEYGLFSDEIRMF